MRLRSKVILKKKLSGETLDSVRIYLREFADGRHTIEHFDGMMSTCLRDRADVELVRRSFPSLIADVRTLY